MLWFHEVKGYGYIRTEAGERVYVDRAGFVDGIVPAGRCAGLAVDLRIEEQNGKRVALDVSMVDEPVARRARRRSGGTRSARS
jgi:cold shock CspA family protein